MRKIHVMQAALLAACAGQAAAQPVVDGTLDVGVYGAPKFVQNQPTSFGDSGPTGPCNPADIGNPATVASGIEVRIPLSALGLSSPAAVKVCAFINNQGHNFGSNQVLGGLPALAGNLGNLRAVNFASIAGNQFATISATSTSAPSVDGIRDASYVQVGLQTNRTSFGDSTSGVIDVANGSELDAVYGVFSGGFLHLFLSGNLESNFNKLEIFIDSKAGGLNRLTGSLPDVDSGALQNMADDGSGNGLTFDSGFTADYYMTFGLGGEPATYYPNWVDIQGSVGRYLGNAMPGGDGVLSGGDNPDDIRVGLDNSNTAGVPGLCPPPAGDPDIALGSEIDNVYATVVAGRLYIFMGGNLQNNFNKFDLFFDAADGGQNQILVVGNPDIDFGALGSGKLGGLVFEPDFAADYWLSFSNDAGVQLYGNAAVLRTDGFLQHPSGNPLDYGAYRLGPKATTNPIPWDGPQLDVQDGFTTSIFTNYAPRIAGYSLVRNPPASYTDPIGVPGAILQSINNSNIAGVTGTTADPVAAAAVTTGYELAIDLCELGWDGFSPIKIAGFLANASHDFVSNQVIGGLPAADQLGAPAGIDFGAIAGSQQIVINADPCNRIDYNHDAVVDFGDYLEFLNAYDGSTLCADLNNDGVIDFSDYLEFLNLYDSCGS